MWVYIREGEGFNYSIGASTCRYWSAVQHWNGVAILDDIDRFYKHFPLVHEVAVIGESCVFLGIVEIKLDFFITCIQH